MGHVYAEISHPRQQGGRGRGAAGGDLHGVVQPALGQPGVAEHGQDGRRGAEVGDALGSQRLPDPVRVDLAQADVPGGGRGDAPGEAPAAAVEHRQGPQVDAVRGQLVVEGHGQGLQVCAAMVVHHALGASGRPAGVVHAEQAVLVAHWYGERLGIRQQGLVLVGVPAGLDQPNHSGRAGNRRPCGVGAAGMVRLVEAGGYADEYESLLADAEPLAIPVSDEYGLLSVNYTSGTTGRPKGVMYHHRGAYLQALAMAFHNQLTANSVYLWTLPMFHCSGWCFTWGVTAAAARHVCLRKVDPDRIWQALRTEGVTHFSAAPTVLTMLGNSRLAGGGLDHTVEVTTGGAPPSPALLARMADLGVHMTHLYGLTETYGPVVISEWHREWDALEAAAQAQLKARQGVANVVGSPVRVLDQDAADVPADGVSLGEIALRGNNVMLGYYRDPDATAEATADGYFRTGDLGVVHPDGYVELTDRSKDVIISGGENIASIEVERAVETHPAVLEAAVVGRPDEKWGEVPVAYVTLHAGADADDAEIIAHVRSKIAHFKAPKQVIFGELPKTSTGKIQKHELRARR